MCAHVMSGWIFKKSFWCSYCWRWKMSKRRTSWETDSVIIEGCTSSMRSVFSCCCHSPRYGNKCCLNHLEIFLSLIAGSERTTSATGGWWGCWSEPLTQWLLYQVLRVWASEELISWSRNWSLPSPSTRVLGLEELHVLHVNIISSQWDSRIVP